MGEPATPRRCAGVTPNGPCRARPVTGSDWCRAHNPDTADTHRLNAAKYRDTALVARLVDTVAKGVPIGTACRSAGIDRGTLQRWRNHPDPPPELIAVLAALDTADATAEVGLVEQIRTAETWQAAAWLLERRWSDRWGRERNTTPDTNAVQPPTPAELAALLEQTRETG